VAAGAAIGFRVHSGWAAAVAVVALPDGPAVVARRRIEMVDRKVRGAAQPYHAAKDLGLVEAAGLIAYCATRASELATDALRAMTADLRGLGHEVAGCGLLLASGRALPPLEKILASHAMIHTAEGELFRNALRAAAANCSLPLTAVKERDLYAQAEARLQLTHDAIDQAVARMGKAIGPPWRQDEKFAALVAWLAL
jgi:hypothetical protein